MSGRTEIARVRGLGASRQGTHHWWMMRVTSLAVLLLSTWLVVSLLLLPDYEHATVVAWLRQPVAAIPMVLFAASVFHHLHLGLQELIEDYVHAHGAKIASLLALKTFSIVGAFVAIFSILKIALGA